MAAGVEAMSDITSRPYRPLMACEKCAFNRGPHAEFCGRTFVQWVADPSKYGSTSLEWASCDDCCRPLLPGERIYCVSCFPDHDLCGQCQHPRSRHAQNGPCDNIDHEAYVECQCGKFERFPVSEPAF